MSAARWKCPECQSDALIVMVMVAAELHQYGDENFETDADGDHEWDGDSLMTCKGCGHVGPSRDFEQDAD